MDIYQNLSGRSNVARYEIGNDCIVVEFGDQSLYLYDHTRPGPSHVARMKQLACAGEGLNTYINKMVRRNYACKMR